MILPEFPKDISWQRGDVLPLRADIDLDPNNRFVVRSGVGVYPGIVVDDTASGTNEAWIIPDINGKPVRVVAMPSSLS